VNPLRKLAGQTAIYGMSSIIGRLLNYLLVPIYTRVFIPSEFGVIAELYAYIAFLNVLLTYGMETSFFRHYADGNDKQKVYSSSFLSLLVTSAIFVLAVYILSKPLAALIRYPDNEEYILWLALIVALDAVVTIPFAKLRADNRPRAFAALKLLNIGFNIGFNLFFIVLCPWLLKNHPETETFVRMVYNPDIGVGYVFIANLLASILTCIMLLPFVIKIKLQFDKTVWKNMTVYALPLLIAGMAGIANETIDRILLKFLLPPDVAMSQLGIYSACYKISIIITIFIQAFRFAADPFFFSQARDKDARSIYAQVMNYFIITCLLIFLVIMMYMDVVKHFVGEDYHEGLPVVPILLLANVFLGIFYNLSIWYKLSGKTIYGAYLAIFGAAVTLTLNFLWIPIWGYYGAAWATLICYAAMMALSYYFGQKHYPVHYNIKKTAIYFAAALALYALSLLLEPYTGRLQLVANSFIVLAFVGLIFGIEKNRTSKLNTP
jgi:O-antigen/teichoic acid export membrane protein